MDLWLSHLGGPLVTQSNAGHRVGKSIFLTVLVLLQATVLPSPLQGLSPTVSGLSDTLLLWALQGCSHLAELLN